MQHEINRFANDFFRSAMRDKPARWKGAWLPAVDMYEGAEAFTLKAELPGFSKDDVQVEIKDNVLTLKGERKRESDAKKAQYYRVERAYGTFWRSFRLPAFVNADQAEATFKDGLLELTLPKAEETKPKQIRITA